MLCRDHIDDLDLIFDIDSQAFIRKDELGDRSVFAVAGGYDVPQGGRVKYITSSSPKTRRLYHEDVLPYNAGGNRMYSSGDRFFVKQESEIHFLRADGNSEALAGTPKTFLTAFTENQAKAAVDELNSLFGTLRSKYGVTDTGDLMANHNVLQGLIGNKAVDQLIRAHNKWNVNIESVEDLLEFLKQYGLNPGRDVSFAVDGEPLQAVLQKRSELSNFVTGVNSEETVRDAAVKGSARARKDTPLQGYGGTKAELYGPTESIEREFVSAINFKEIQAYSQNAVRGWLKGAAKHIISIDESEPNLYKRMMSAELSKTEAGRKFEQERNIISRRLNAKNPTYHWWRGMTRTLGEFVFDSGFYKTGRFIDNYLSKDPTVALRSFAFNYYLGIFNVKQLVTQASQMVNTIAIGGTQDGLQSAAIGTVLFRAMLNGNEQVVKTMGRRAEAFTGISADELWELTQFLEKSGRGYIGTNIATFGNDFYLAKGAASEVASMGRFFFENGERLARYGAAGLAYRKFRRLFPGQSLSSPQAELWMANQMSTYMQNMTKSGRAGFQTDSLASIVTQFYSYSLRMLEQIFFGSKGLSNAERARLATSQITMWGLSGYGVGSALDYAITEFGVELDSISYTAIKYGILDAAIQALTGTKTAFGSNLGFGSLFYDTFKDLTEANFLDVLAGPSGELAKNVYTDLMYVVGDIIHGRTSAELKYDLTRFARNVSSGNKLYNSWMMLRYGEYVSRNGSVLADDMGAGEAVFNLLGAPLQEVTLAYDVREIMKNEDKIIAEAGRRIKERINIAYRLIEEGKTEEANAIFEDIAFERSLMTPWEQRQTERYIKPDTGSLLQDLLINSYKQERTISARLLKYLSDEPIASAVNVYGTLGTEED